MSKFFNAFHSPLGAHSSFTLGCKGKSGGLGLEKGGPACENVYIGLENSSDHHYSLLPFFCEDDDESLRYDHDQVIEESNNRSKIFLFKDEEIERKFRMGTDTWCAGDLECTIYSTPYSAPDPSNSTEEDQKFSFCPAVTVEFIIDNRNCSMDRTALFGYDPANNSDSPNIIENLPQGYKGIASGRSTSMITDDEGVMAAQGFSVENILSEDYEQNYNFGLGCTTLLLFKVPSGERKSFHISICFFRDGIVTTGVETSYWYNRFFKSIYDVGVFALENFERYRKVSLDVNKEFDSPLLNDSQRFQMYHAIRSYYGSTQLLDWNDEPFWVVNEGEYRMMNTFDLTVDQLFFEMRQNPWTVKNVLDLFIKRYSYFDNAHFPDKDNIHQGGISFTHDMGVRNHISPAQYSSYEKFGSDACFSHMSHEQLVNWILCASVYVRGSGDKEWFADNKNVFKQCLISMMNRDNPDSDKRNGLMALDSSRTIKGSEITTYDSLDESLGQARNNLYMAVKCWASYISLSELLDDNYALLAKNQAVLTAKSICEFQNEEGYIPAIMGEGCDAQIIPAIEGLVFPWFMGFDEALKEDGLYGHLIKALKKHFQTILKKGRCLYPDDGWKLSSSTDNSWLSKVYLSQFVARQIFGIVTPETKSLADRAHQSWLLKEENLFFAWSDQMRSGVAFGSKYYPRGVTSILWLRESNEYLNESEN
ncbi:MULTISPECIES: glycoside hydrolase family 52 protein [unclassified Oceanispirochaeta]|uniref:glycoside hydrolase family 52 protein n=1 Tax=unclassified Oceanispirochaeta TaxID=2635722 RepID=UPI000E092DB7|nr:MULTISPECIES: glycoside hydrolase family 52 protein [unclassified Oceanispirochaeta]MBF9017275.1 beta-xylosidase [Oceanispirochaeta sp. M2]NPD73785.1 beta-xylosidase [Oceanispirochaeta sp. M1]RDG30389.1 beta-xylosidase [Oceanispirochaeta sp. M1]